LLTPDSTTSCTLRLYNNASAASGTTFWYQVTKSDNGETTGPMLPFSIPFSIGAYAAITTSGTCSVLMFYQEYIP
jgi:hypothetical protein